LSRGSSPSGYPAEPLVSYQINRQLSGWNLPPLVIRAFGAHCQEPTHAVQHMRVGAATIYSITSSASESRLPRLERDQLGSEFGQTCGHSPGKPSTAGSKSGRSGWFDRINGQPAD
jgi:hypothetical protein